MKSLIIGYGSIGQRHARLLKDMGHEVAVVSSQPVSGFAKFAALEEALSAFAPDYVVICTVTALHAQGLNILKSAGFKGRALVEKPLFMHADEYQGPYPFRLRVAYQLRYHKVMLALKEALKGRDAVSARVHVGQHLANWRPGRDPKTTYSAHRAQGGGVLRDLSHELDLAAYIFGPINDWQGSASRQGDVTVDSEDTASLELRCERCPTLALTMNYLDQIPRREWEVTTSKGTVKADLIAKSISVDGRATAIACAPDDAYRNMHQAIVSGRDEAACTLEEGLALAQLIDKVPVT